MLSNDASKDIISCSGCSFGVWTLIYIMDQSKLKSKLLIFLRHLVDTHFFRFSFFTNDILALLFRVSTYFGSSISPEITDERRESSTISKQQSQRSGSIRGELSNLVTTPFLSTHSHHFCFPYASLPLLFCHGECITLNDVTFTQTKLETNIAVYIPHAP